ncbi:hypothetical protein EJ02DRAFT_496561 [Clathrospora elynae]|uniref:Uncharacterized protein n=1 Tax=Clathrospora elynae TaxID=706981 RepID=A0A6A5T159_9PLEO|nr:hypothetical protein EJ02DRAFT_496561 [Clathrospora elynae]
MVYLDSMLVPSLAILKKYTGWFSHKNGIRIIITLDVGILRLGFLDLVDGSIFESWLLFMSDVPAFNIGGASKEEAIKNWGFQAIARTYTGGHMATFDIKNGEVKSVEMDGHFYARTESGVCMIFDVPLEVRQMIWGHALCVSARDMQAKLYSPSEPQQRFPEPREPHPPSRSAVRDRSGAFSSSAATFSSAPAPATSTTHCASPKQTRGPNSVVLAKWRFKDTPATSLQEFMAYGRGIREAILGTRSGVALVNDLGMICAWRDLQPVSVLDVDNVKFFPMKEEFGETVFREQVEYACRKVPTFVPRVVLAYHLIRSRAIELLLTDVRSWYESVI